MEPPVWLNTEFLAAVVADNQEHVNVIDYEVTAAVPAGSNYLSHIYRIKLRYSNGSSGTVHRTSLIVKAPLVDGIMKDFMEKLNTVGREKEIYSLVLPQINRYLGKDTVTAKNFFSPRDDVLVFEDLNLRGYRMCDRIKQLDRDHCISSMRTMAKFHASSVALHNAEPELVERVGKEIVFSEDTSWSEDQDNFIEACFTYTANGLKSVKSYEMFSEMVLGQIDTTKKKLISLFSNKKHIQVLNHGDMWTNNILFRHDKHGRVTDLKLVDFQVCKYASPGIDIQYFLVTCPNADVRHDGFNDLLEEYRKTLNSTLHRLNCKEQLSAEELEDEVRYAEPFALYVMCCMFPVMLADPENPPKVANDKETFESCDPNVNTFLQVYYNQYYLDVLVEHLNRLEKRGYFT